MLKYFIVFASLLFMNLSAVTPLEAVTLHAIIVADVDDKNNGVGITAIEQRMEKEVADIALYGGFTLKKKTFLHELDRDKILNYLKDLKVAKEDTVIFYWAGHGFRTSDMKTDWPMLYMNSKKKSLNFNDVIETLLAKKFNMGLIFADTCNPYKDKSITQKEIALDRTLKEDGYFRLFNGSHAIIVTASADKGETAKGDGVNGGYYTRNFFDLIHEEVLQSKPSWSYILNQSAASVEKYNQHPIQEYWTH